MTDDDDSGLIDIETTGAGSWLLMLLLLAFGFGWGLATGVVLL